LLLFVPKSLVGCWFLLRMLAERGNTR